MWRAAAVVVGTVAGAGCEWNSIAPPDAAEHVDARHRVDAADDAMLITDHLLLSEVTLAPTGSEFIEVTNPGALTVDLGQYFLSDSGNYFALPGGSPAISSGDFIVQFPAGTSIPPGGVITVALGTATAFTTAFAVAPTFSIADNTITHVVVAGTPSLTDAGEIVVLFNWDSAADLVKDVDIMIAGKPVATNGLVSKSGLIQGGSAYAPDSNSIKAQPTAPGSGKSTKRIALEPGNETHDGTGNGIGGDDETSEDTSVTWDTVYTAPTPGTIPAF
jgi:hypothetical protein